MRYYKLLTADNKGGYSRFDFTEYLPKDGKPGKWLPKINNIEMCERGYHAFELDHILEWCNEQLFEVELSGDMIGGDTKIVAQQMRFLRKVDTWNDKTARLFACYCARDVLPIFEKEYQNDQRPRIAIETSERYANGEATDSELDASWDAARDAAMDASLAAAWAAARAASWAVSWAVSLAAAWAASRAAALAAARAVSWDAPLAAAMVKYTSHLLEMLGLEGEK